MFNLKYDEIIGYLKEMAGNARNSDTVHDKFMIPC